MSRFYPIHINHYSLFALIISAFLLARPSSEANRIASEKLAAQVELRTIKSIQVELVRHSKLTRKVIKCDKELETIQATYAPKAQKVRSIFRTLRVSTLLILLLTLSMIH